MFTEMDFIMSTMFPLVLNHLLDVVEVNHQYAHLKNEAKGHTGNTGYQYVLRVFSTSC